MLIAIEVGAQALRRAERDPKEEILVALEERLNYHDGSNAKAVATKENAKSIKAPEKPAEQPA